MYLINSRNQCSSDFFGITVHISSAYLSETEKKNCQKNVKTLDHQDWFKTQFPAWSMMSFYKSYFKKFELNIHSVNYKNFD